MSDEYSHFEMMQAKHFIINTEVREAKKNPSKDKTSEELKADVDIFLETQSKIKHIILDYVKEGRPTNTSWDGDHYTLIVDTLRNIGWVGCSSYTTCSKAIKERNLTKGNLVINILVSNFLGLFTQITLKEYSDE